MRRVVCTVLAVVLFGFVCERHSSGQSVTGQIAGAVIDTSGGAVPGALIQLTNELTKQVRNFRTDSAGSFIFPDLMPGNYDLRITLTGFKSFIQNGIAVSAQERVNVHTLTLQVGDVSASIEVVADSVHIATDSSDRSITVNSAQIAATPVRGRDFQSIIRSLPGVLDVAGNDTRGWGTVVPAINGGQLGQTMVSLDGVTSQSTGAVNQPGYLAPSIDAISEVKLLVSNAPAEYGGRAGGEMTVTIKPGTSDFHGTAYYYWRHEQFNANSFFNNKLGVPKARYRYNNPGGTVGGPLLIPKTNFNQNRDKLFFFFSYDYLHNLAVIGPTFYTMPTALERQGDFSKTVTTTGALVPIFDSTAGAPFPGNIVPTSRITPAGLAFLNKFPLPNGATAADPTGLSLDPTGRRQYNSRYTFPQSNPRQDKILRLDYNWGSKDTAFMRLIQDYQSSEGYGAILGPFGSGWGQFAHQWAIASSGAVGTWIHSFSPSLVNEASWGINRSYAGIAPTDYLVSNNSTSGARVYSDSQYPLKDASGNTIALPNIFGQTPQNILPAINFGLPGGFSAQSAGQTIANAPSFGLDGRWPHYNTDQVQSMTDKITWIRGPHTVKAGFYFERAADNARVNSTYNQAGTYYFGVDRANPFDTGFPLSNLLTGGFFAYGQDNRSFGVHARYNQAEWFLQDTWRLSRRWTLDYGIRFVKSGDIYGLKNRQALFDGDAYSATNTGQLLYPACSVSSTGVCPAANRIAINPATGAIFPYVRQGTFDTASYPGGGLPFSGLVPSNGHIFSPSPVKLGPHLGFAWDVFGRGKTAVRGGWGVTYGRAFALDATAALAGGQGPVTTPPNFQAPVILYNNIAGLAGAQPYFSPQNVLTGGKNIPIPSTYNWSIGVQQDLGSGLVADVTYIGNVAHNRSDGANNNQIAIDINGIPPYTVWNPTTGAVAKYIDPTTGAFYPTNLIRAMTGYAGWGSINAYTATGESYYEALQASLNKRRGKANFGFNYTWSKTITYTRAQFVPDQLTKSVATGTRPHSANLNFGVELPGGSHLLPKAKWTRVILDGWHVDGNGAFYFGTPLTVNCTAVGAPPLYWTGTPTNGPSYIPFRCQMGSNIWLSSGYPSTTEDPKLQYPFSASNFTLPPANSLGIGNTPPVLSYGPGFVNVDIALSKELKMRKEGHTLEFKMETFNTLNHFNPANPNTTLNLNYATGANTNSAFGTISTAASANRRGVLSLRYRF